MPHKKNYATVGCDADNRSVKFVCRDLASASLSVLLSQMYVLSKYGAIGEREKAEKKHKQSEVHARRTERIKIAHACVRVRHRNGLSLLLSWILIVCNTL